MQTFFPRLQQDKAELQAAGILKHHTFVVRSIRHLQRILGLFGRFFIYDDASCLQGQVICLSHLHEAVTNVEFIFEAIKEDLDAKQEIFESKRHY